LRDSGLVVGLELQFGFFLVSSFSHSFRSCLEFALVCQLGLKLDLRFFSIWCSRSLSLVFLGFGAPFEILHLELELVFIALELELRF
jgi:hypothetical protein